MQGRNLCRGGICAGEEFVQGRNLCRGGICAGEEFVQILTLNSEESSGADPGFFFFKGRVQG